METGKTVMYAVLFFGALLFAWVAMGTFGMGMHQTGTASAMVDEKGMLVKNSGNEKYFSQMAQQSGSECGDLQDMQNLQHLSHHPSRYKECLKLADSSLLKQATGKTYEELVGK